MPFHLLPHLDRIEAITSHLEQFAPRRLYRIPLWQVNPETGRPPDGCYAVTEDGLWLPKRRGGEWWKVRYSVVKEEEL